MPLTPRRCSQVKNWAGSSPSHHIKLVQTHESQATISSNYTCLVLPKKYNPKKFCFQLKCFFDYPAPARQPNLNRTESDKLDRLQSKALRAKTGQCSSTAVEALQIEISIVGYRTYSTRLVASSYRKALEYPPDHPHIQIVYTPAASRLRSSSRRKETGELTNISSRAVLSWRPKAHENYPSGPSSNYCVNNTINRQNENVN